MAVFALSLFSRTGVADTEAYHSKLRSYLYDGKIDAGAQAFEGMLAQEPNNRSIRACLGLLQYLQAVEGLGQDYYRYGFSDRGFRPFSPMGVTTAINLDPEEISYDDARQVFERLLKRLTRAEETLSKFSPTNFKLVLSVDKIHLDIDRNGSKDPEEQLIRVATRVMGMQNIALVDKPIEFAFDDADVYWLRGYMHVMSALTEMILAHDWRDWFERTGHLAFSKVKSPYPFLKRSDTPWSADGILDIIASIHSIHFEVREPLRMQRALEHIESVLQLSRETWKRIREETDNDREWLPGPTQNSIILGNQLGGQMGANWEKVLDRLEAIVQGKELLPFWRGVESISVAEALNNGATRNMINPKLGINFRKIFTHPQPFDAVIWLQGTGVAPFLEEGRIADPTAWTDLSNRFNNRLPFFSFWIN